MSRICFISVTLILIMITSACDKDTSVNKNNYPINGNNDKIYEPGLGEFMLNIQIHHDKLWFAGNDKNWALAKFELDEIRENVENIRQFCADRPELKFIGMLPPALNNLDSAIHSKSQREFNRQFTSLTATCNACHSTTGHNFIKIKIPGTEPFDNQEYK